MCVCARPALDGGSSQKADKRWRVEEQVTFGRAFEQASASSSLVSATLPLEQQRLQQLLDVQRPPGLPPTLPLI
jgi:hypothetical protein